MKKIIVTTTINAPTLALRKFMKLEGWFMIVVGDKKTPHHFYQKNKNILYLHPNDQEKISKNLSDLIGWNCIQRRNFGYLIAYKMGAQLIATIDDDNIPYSDWGKEILIGKKVSADFYKTSNIAFDPLSIFKKNSNIWHRGFPLQLLEKRFNFSKIKKIVKADVQANLWNMAPDIDAINRMSLKKENFKFNKVNPYFSNKISPFNSQNTILSKDIIKNYFLFPHVGRMDDIWAAYYVQSLGYKVIFSYATVYQKRNYHNIYKDFQNELIGYNNNLALINSLSENSNNIKKFLPTKSYQALKVYEKLFV
jgi:hypothetical protein